MHSSSFDRLTKYRAQRAYRLLLGQRGQPNTCELMYAVDFLEARLATWRRFTTADLQACGLPRATDFMQQQCADLDQTLRLATLIPQGAQAEARGDWATLQALWEKPAQQAQSWLQAQLAGEGRRPRSTLTVPITLASQHAQPHQIYVGLHWQQNRQALIVALQDAVQRDGAWVRGENMAISAAALQASEAWPVLADLLRPCLEDGAALLQRWAAVKAAYADPWGPAPPPLLWTKEKPDAGCCPFKNHNRILIAAMRHWVDALGVEASDRQIKQAYKTLKGLERTQATRQELRLPNAGAIPRVVTAAENDSGED